MEVLGEGGQNVQTSVISIYWNVKYSMATRISNTILHVGKFAERIHLKSSDQREENIFF